MDAPIAMKERASLPERVARRLPERFTDECWEWPGHRSENGYGVIRRGGKDEPCVRVTRIVFEMFHGPVPEEHRLVMHTCDNPPCVNPGHLISGTDGDNMADKAAKGRAGRKLVPSDILAIRAEPRGGQALAARYGVSYTTIKLIRRRKT